MGLKTEIAFWGLGLAAAGVGSYFALAKVTRDEAPPNIPQGTKPEPVTSTSTRTTKGYHKGNELEVTLKSVGGAHELRTDAADAFLAMQAAAKADGVDLVVVSAFRDMAKQTQLFDLYKAGRGNLAAAPGWSNHQEGLSVDLDTRSYVSAPFRWLWSNASRYGFKNNVLTEHWHWTWMPGLLGLSGLKSLNGVKPSQGPVSGVNSGPVAGLGAGVTASPVPTQQPGSATPTIVPEVAGLNSAPLLTWALPAGLAAVLAYQLFIRPDEGPRTFGKRPPDPAAAARTRAIMEQKGLLG